MSAPRRRRVGEAKKKRLLGHRNLSNRTGPGVRYVSDTDTTPKMACQCNPICMFSFSFGYHWIRRKGKPAPREIAPIVVSNHVSYIEPIFYFYELFPTIVVAEFHDSIPFVGTIIRAMQVIYVNRFSPPSRKHAINEIMEKPSSYMVEMAKVQSLFHISSLEAVDFLDKFLLMNPNPRFHESIEFQVLRRWLYYYFQLEKQRPEQCLLRSF
ncbi:hypothetical protein SO802_016565 [Lithocarpus litseifolius]|uniref:Phospholipid/glycerol acyltransferase domain-containing protein n=1 Tax=Lithocarpus litseifolius TaxID=425828 RepID=A0AAW2CZE3_9ROSI